MIDMDERSHWEPARHLMVIGPGASGKSSLGSELQPLMKRRLFDLDIEFLRRIGDIGVFIRDEGYEQYKLRNSRLADEITTETDSPIIFVASSGFLTPDNPEAALEYNKCLLAACYSICLLPSRDFEKAVEVIVRRQLTRPFSRDRQREEDVIRDRYSTYAGLGDLVVFSTAPSNEIARTVAHHLGYGESLLSP
jgi:shikimate kinase